MSAGETGSPAEVTRRYLDVETPENVPLPFELAPLSSRFFALLIDVILVNVTLVLVALGAAGIATAVSANMREEKRFAEVASSDDGTD